jgi:hypothetical protein
MGDRSNQRQPATFLTLAIADKAGSPHAYPGESSRDYLRVAIHRRTNSSNPICSAIASKANSLCRLSGALESPITAGFSRRTC